MNRFSAIQNIRLRLSSGGVSVGSWMQIPHASVAEIMGRAGYDWVAVDMEHGTISPHQLPDMFRALELGGTLPLVRLAEGHPKDCKQALDAGAGGVIVPMVESAEQLRAVRDNCCWPPTGSRGVGFSRANLFGGDFDAYMLEARAPMLVAMIENARAVERLDGILKVEGLDAILVGPYDLSASMGLTGMFDHDDFKTTMQQIRDLAKGAGVPAGVHVVKPAESELSERISEGYRFLAYSIDAVMLRIGAECPSDGRMA
jgi:2-dehydro-3-deoxyglucarate aldolase